MIDEEKLQEYRQRTIISGVYLDAWNRVNEHLSKSTKFNLRDYIVSIDEDDVKFIFTLSKPFLKPVLGGGVGNCMLDKKTNEVQCKLIK